MEEDQRLVQGLSIPENGSLLHQKTIEEIIELAVEFHGNGDIVQAASIYRMVLEIDPDQVHANFNLATICHGNGNMEEAITCYNQVLKADPDNFQVLFFLAGAYRDQGCLESAAHTYQLAIDSDPEQADAHYNLGGICQHLDNPERAVECYKKALALDALNAPAFYNLGIVCYEIGEYDEAIRYYERALELTPDDVDTYYNLALVHSRKGHLHESVSLYLRALELAPDDADLYHLLGQLWKKLKNFDEAENCFRQAVRLKPDFGAAYTNLAVIFHTVGKNDEAIECYSKAIELGYQTEMADHMLGALTGSTRTSMPDNYVRNLFDAYADGFDDSLVVDLGYNTPLSLVKTLCKFAGKSRRYERALDLGCGTGLAGEAFRGVCDRLDGVDVSSKMLAKAEQKNLYDMLLCSDILDFLAASDEKYNLVIAADVLNYVGELDVVFRRTEHCLADRGLFVFSVEKLKGEGGCRLQSSGRYAHGRKFVEKCCTNAGLVVKVCRETAIRKERGEWIKGQLFVLQKN